jgi:L-iditol 2-dehydrogenase
LKAIQLHDIGAVWLTDLPDPEPGDDEVLIRVIAAGMCGSDRHLVSGDYPGKPPVVLGHEFEGVVLGGAVSDNLRVGARVTVDPNIHCGVCAPCRRGLVATAESCRPTVWTATAVSPSSCV